ARGAVALEQGQALAPTRDEEKPRVQALEELAAGLIHPLLVVRRHPRELSQLGLVGRRRRDARKARQLIAAVHAHDRAGPARERPDALEDARGDRAVAVVGDQDRVGAGPERGEPREERVLARGDELTGRLAVETYHLLARRLVAARHD